MKLTIPAVLCCAVSFFSCTPQDKQTARKNLEQGRKELRRELKNGLEETRKDLREGAEKAKEEAEKLNRKK